MSTMLSLLPSLGSGSGSSLPLPVLLLSGISTLVATVVSVTSIFLHIRNYRKPRLQRYVSVWSHVTLITCESQNGHPNHAHGPFIRHRVPHISVFARGSILHRRSTRHLRGTSLQLLLLCCGRRTGVLRPQSGFRAFRRMTVVLIRL